MIEDADYRVVYLNFPGDIKGSVRVDADGFATIYLNNQLAPDAKADAFVHEIQHVERDDFYNDLSIYTVEKG